MAAIVDGEGGREIMHGDRREPRTQLENVHGHYRVITFFEFAFSQETRKSAKPLI